MKYKNTYCAIMPKNKRTKCYIKYRPFPDNMYNQAIIDASATNSDSEFNNPIYRIKQNRVMVCAVNKPADSDMFTWKGIGDG